MPMLNVGATRMSALFWASWAMISGQSQSVPRRPVGPCCSLEPIGTTTAVERVRNVSISGQVERWRSMGSDFRRGVDPDHWRHAVANFEENRSRERPLAPGHIARICEQVAGGMTMTQISIPGAAFTGFRVIREHGLMVLMCVLLAGGVYVPDHLILAP